MCERLWRWPEAKECLCLAILVPSSDLGCNRLFIQPVCQCWGHVPAALGWAWGLPSPAACSPTLQWGRQAQVCRTTVYRAQLPLCPCACAAPSCHYECLSPQGPVSWSTMGRPGMSTASSAAAASSPSGRGPSSQTRRIITVSPATRASLLRAALAAKRYRRLTAQRP